VKILVVGASGFIGRHVVAALSAAGHHVVRGVHGEIDFERDTDPRVWLPRLQGIDAVVNAVGIIREGPGQSFAAVHEAGPRALYEACERLAMRKVVQISALGADAGAQSAFHRSKKNADAELASRPLAWVIVLPSLVFGSGGASARLFALLASLPWVALPGNGLQRVQPIHIDDLAELVARLFATRLFDRTRIEAVGPRALTLREWLATLRRQLGLPGTFFLRVPLALVRLAIGEETLGMLLRGNTASAATITRVLGRPPRPVEAFVSPAESEFLRTRARLDWLLPALRASVAIVWLVSGVVSLGLYPVADSMAMLARVGLTGILATLVLYGAALLDIAFGAAIYLVKHRRWLWRAQIAVVLGYSIIIALRLPELWLHPFGPLVKNLPFLAAIVLLHELEERG
jgi:uncharacterized protein YbjT (DUF2867 family)